MLVPLPSPPPPASIRTQVEVPLALPDGSTTTARVVTFNGLVDGLEHLAFGLGRYAERHTAVGSSPATPVRLHSECLTGDVFGSQRCDCGAQLRESIVQLATEGGFLLYLRQEGRGIGLYAKLDTYVLQDVGLDTYEANVALGYAVDQRNYTVAAQMLLALGQPRVAMLTNNPDKVAQLRRLGIDVVTQVPTGLHVSDANVRYLAAKARHGDHTLDLAQLTGAGRARPRAAP
ncbi:GTP cyclohydrolase [Phycicoccus sp. Root563]|uniref:GTP cyclohydrolase II n=1 Tax=Phycicoccus sp. Root563 TaxID=1736562 RepID=UPI00070242B0|nr:GTP cyclohydrolase II [Phycicoccus sp. Root563]KQZ88327.1 GTP cyclohydrolase [Phycicoccus sp. Root563]